MNLSIDIKTIITNYIKKEYIEYINIQKILFIIDEKIEAILLNIYDKNTKKIKSKIRQELKNKYLNDYPSGTIENILLDIFQDKEYAIGIITNNIIHYQNMNYKNITIPIFNNSLNLNINITDNIIFIKNINRENIVNYDKYSDVYETLDKYKYIYSINNKILTEYDDSEKIAVIKNATNNNDSIELGLYYLKSNND